MGLRPSNVYADASDGVALSNGEGARQQRPGGNRSGFEPQLLSAASTFAMPTLCISTATRESVLGCAMSVCRTARQVDQPARERQP